MPIAHRFKLPVLVGFFGIFLISGCAIFSPQPKVPNTSGHYKAGPVELPYAPPENSGQASDAFSLAESDIPTALQAAKAKLVTAGLQDVRVDTRSNRITGRSLDPAMVDCGTLVVSSDEGSKAVPGSSALAVLPANLSGPVDFVRRSFSSETDFDVKVGPSSSGTQINAQVSERHRVAVSIVSADRKQTLNREKASIESGETVRLASNMSCRSAGLVRQILD